MQLTERSSVAIETFLADTVDNVKDLTGFQKYIPLTPSNSKKDRQEKGVNEGLSNTQLKKAGLYFNPQEVTLEGAQQLHKLWQEYATELWQNVKQQQQGAEALCNELEYIGCKLKVCRANNPRLMHREGIVMMESRTNFHLAEERIGKYSALPEVKVIVVPKKGTEYLFHIPGADKEFITSKKAK